MRLWVLLLIFIFAAAAADQPAPKLSNGVYAVLKEAPDERSLDAEKAPHVTLLYDRVYSEKDVKQPPRYVALEPSPYVPLVLARAPELAGEYRGHPMLNLSLAPQNVKRLEEFTRDHIDGLVAVVVDGEIVTMHKVRAAITNGEVQISRCDDDACRVLRMKLTK